MFRRADEAKPNRAMLGLRLALIEKERGHRDQALQQLDQYFAAKTTSAGMLPYQCSRSCWPMRATRHEPRRRPAARPPPAALLDRLQALAAEDPHNVFLGYFLADRLRAAALWDEAVAQYRKMLAAGIGRRRTSGPGRDLHSAAATGSAAGTAGRGRGTDRVAVAAGSEY